jgi:tRNA (guanine10-N2)-methyltransferase
LRWPEVELAVLEEYEPHASEPHTVFFGRLLGHSGRAAIGTYSLKKRHYLATTSMDSELALIGANLVLADAGKLVYDPFIGTGSLPLACTHFGAMAYGSDIDPRTVRGKDGLNIDTSFRQYGLQAQYLGSFIGDLTHSPLRILKGGLLDAIVCDPPYGVREGLRVLGSRNGRGNELVMIDGKPAHLYAPADSTTARAFAKIGVEQNTISLPSSRIALTPCWSIS